MCVTGTGHAAASDDNGLLVCLFVCCMLLFCKVLAMQCVSQGQATHSSRRLFVCCVLLLLLPKVRAMQCVSQGQATQHHQTIMDCLFVCLLYVVVL